MQSELHDLSCFGAVCSFTLGKHMAQLCGDATFRDDHGFLRTIDTDGDARRSRDMQAALYAEGASTHSWTPKIPQIPFQTDELSDETGVPRVGGTTLILQGSCPLLCCRSCTTIVTTPSVSPPPPAAEQTRVCERVLEVDGCSRPGIPWQPCPAALSCSRSPRCCCFGDGTSKIHGRVYNTELPPT